MAEPQTPQPAPQQPQPVDGGMNYDEFKQAIQSGAEARDPQRPGQPPEQHPVRRFFDRLINGEHGEGFTTARAMDVVRSAGRGALNMVNEGVETLGEGENYAADKLGLFNSDADKQEYEQKGGEQFTRDRIEKAGLHIPVDEALGKRSDDLAAQFTEDATQFMSGFALTGAVGELGEAKGLYGLATRVARGALVEGTMFDPHSGSMAQLLAKAPWGWVQSMGQSLMEKPGDSDLVVRMKRAASGAIPAVAIDGLVELAHIGAARKAIAAGATGEAKSAAEAQIEKSQQTLAKIAAGTHTPEGAHVVVRPTEDGNWVLRAVRALGEDNSPLMGSDKPTLSGDAFRNNVDESIARVRESKVDPEAAAAPRPEANRSPEWKAASDEQFKILNDPNATAEAKQAAQAKLDELGAEGSKPYPPSSRENPNPEIAKRMGLLDDAPVAGKDRAEMEHWAESINNSINERLQAARNINGITTEQANELRGWVNKLMTAPTEEDLKGLVEGTHFNFSYYNEPDQVLSMIEGVSKVWRGEIDAAQKVGGVSVDRHFEMVQELMGRIPKADQPAVLKDLLEKGGPVPRSVTQSAADLVMREYAAKAVKLADVIEQRPHDFIAMEEARKAASTLKDLQQALAGDVSETGRSLRMTQERQNFADKVAKVGLNSAEAEAAANGTEAPRSTATFTDGPGKDIAGMKQRPVRTPLSDEETKTILRVAKLANGDVNALYGVGKTAQVIKEGGTLKGALEVGINSMLSGVPTAATVHIMGVVNSYYHAITKFVGSAMVGSGAGMREAIDYMSSLEMHAVDNLKVARMAAIEGRSVINPVNTHEVIGGHLLPDGAPESAKAALDVAGNTARLPSKVLTGSEEFTRVSNYRADVYATSMRYWRGKGLEGEALANQVANDLDAAFTKDGVATLPGPLAKADALTMRQPLGAATLGNQINQLSNFSFATKLVAPFVKTSVNMARWQFERTPGLNFFLRNSREILMGKQGVEAAAQLATQTAVSGWMAYYAWTRAAKSELTGRGPANPATRPMWLEDHKPYSIKIDGHWVSYNRGDPLMQMMAIAADAHTILNEVNDQPKYQGKAADMFFASVAGFTAALGDKSFMRNSTDFFEAWAGGKSELLKKWAYGTAASFVPYSNLMRSTNNDAYLHEITGMQDELFSMIPGLSDKLPAKYDLFGNPMMRAQSMFPFKDNGSAEPGVGTELMKLGKAFAPINRKQFMGLPIELDDRDKFNDGPAGLSPYERANQLLAHPKNGKPLQEQLQKLVESSDYQKASPGSVDFPGGDRWIQAASIIQGAQHEALAQVMREYPSLRREMEIRSQEKGASIEGGQAGADKVLMKAGRK